MDFQSWWAPGAGAFTGLVVVDFLIRNAALGIVPHDRKPSAALAWLAVIFSCQLSGR